MAKLELGRATPRPLAVGADEASCAQRDRELVRQFQRDYAAASSPVKLVVVVPELEVRLDATFAHATIASSG